MQNKLEITEVFAGHSIRIVGTPENPLFCATDVCAVLGISNSRDALAGLDEDEKASVALADTSSSTRNTITMLHVTESGLYALVFKSRKPEAKKFRKWVTSEVLPSIRKTGSYSSAPAFVIPTTLSGALMLAAKQAEQIEQQTAALAIAAPKVEFHDAVMASQTVCQMGVACQTAKLKFGRNILYRKLREMGVMIDGGNRHNLPTQEYVNRGLFTVEESKYNHPYTDEPIIKFTAYATQKGLAWIIKTFKNVEA